MSIETFSFPATELAYPAITVCKRQKYDMGEYLRAVFDNFEYSCNGSVADSMSCVDSMLLRDHFQFHTGGMEPNYYVRNFFCGLRTEQLNFFSGHVD